MYYSLTGTLIAADTRAAVIDCCGVAYQCGLSLHTLGQLPSIGEAATLYTHLHVREDAMELFGFATLEERDLFRLLIGVSGVGAKVALSLLSSMPPDRLLLAIAASDQKALKAPGVGAKLAARICMELSGKVGDLSPQAGQLSASSSAAQGGGAVSAMGEAVAALAALGFSQTDASVALSTLNPALSVEELVRQGLKSLSKQA